MSWLSRAEHAFINLVSGAPANTNVIPNPTTPVESAINAASSFVIPLLSHIPGSNLLAAGITDVDTLIAALEGKATPAQQTQASSVISGVTTTLGTEAAMAVNTFLINKVGTTNTALVDSGAEALATAAIAMMSQSSNKSVDEIAAALSGLVSSFASNSATITVNPPASPAA